MESTKEGDTLRVHEDRGLLRFLFALLSGMAIGVLATAYFLRWAPIKRDLPIEPDFTLTVDTSATTIKMVDEQGNSIGEIRNWTADPIVVRIRRIDKYSRGKRD